MNRDQRAKEREKLRAFALNMKFREVDDLYDLGEAIERIADILESLEAEVTEP